MARIALIVLTVGACGAAACAADPARSVHQPAIAFKLAQSTAECRRLVPQFPAVCDPLSAASAQLEIARADVNRDGAEDLVVRLQSRLTCGSHGCSTDVYLRKAEKYVRANPPLVTAGPIYRCRQAAGAGLQMTTDRGRGPCIIIK